METERLKSIKLFEPIPDDELAAIAPFAEERVVEAGTPLVKEGQFSYEFMAIEDGKAEVTRGGEHVADLGPGDFFGEIGLLERALRTATVTATSDMRLITLTGWVMKRIEQEKHEAGGVVRRGLEER